MFKRACVVLSLMAATVSLSAKQTITLLDGSELDVKIVTVGTDGVSYKLLSNPDGPTYTTARSKIFFITYDDGTKEVITPMDAPAQDGGSQGQAMTNSLVSTLTNSLTIPSVEPKNYFPKITFFPRVNVGFHATPSGYKDSFDLDWGGFAWACDLNVLFPTGNSSAVTAGAGLAGLSGDLRMLYSIGDKNYNEKVGDLEAMYFTLPIGYYYKCGDWFTFGLGNRFEFLVSQKSGGKKVEDTFNVLRTALFMEGLATIGHLSMGAQIMLNLTNAFKGDGLDWSPTFGVYFTASYCF